MQWYTFREGGSVFSLKRYSLSVQMDYANRNIQKEFIMGILSGIFKSRDKLYIPAKQHSSPEGTACHSASNCTKYS